MYSHKLYRNAFQPQLRYKDFWCSILGEEGDISLLWSHLIILASWHLQFVSMHLWKALSFLRLCYHGYEKCLFHRTYTIYNHDSFIRLSFLFNQAIKELVSMPEKKWKKQQKKKHVHFYSQLELSILQYSLIFILVVLMIHSVFFSCY